MLRAVVGDDSFFEGVRLYYMRHANATALTDDLQRAMEDIPGRDLGWFFDQWLHRPGHPVLHPQWREKGSEVEIVVEQAQSPEWPVFRFPLEVEVVLRDGSRTRETIEVTERRHTLRLPATGPVDRVVLDPDEWLLKEIAD